MNALSPPRAAPLGAGRRAQSNAVLSCSNFIAGTFEPGATAYAFGDRLNIRREASTGGRSPRP